MTRDEIVVAIAEWFKGDKENRGGLVLLGEMKDSVNLGASRASGYNEMILISMLVDLMLEYRAYAKIIKWAYEEYLLRCNEK